MTYVKLVKPTATTIPYKDICDKVFKSELLPAVYRWISALSKEELARFNLVFPRLVCDDASDRPMTRTVRQYKPLASKYTMPDPSSRSSRRRQHRTWRTEHSTPSKCGRRARFPRERERTTSPRSTQQSAPQRTWKGGARE